MGKYIFSIIITLISVLIKQSGFAQSIHIQSVNSGGAITNQSNGSLNFTIGELLVKDLVDSKGNSLGGGITVGSTLTTLNIINTDLNVLSVIVFPNPTTNMLYVKIADIKIEYLMISITDVKGKEIYTGKYAGLNNTIGVNMLPYSPGLYYLSLKNTNNDLLGYYKIVKKQ
jgi:hypothetical protein